MTLLAALVEFIDVRYSDQTDSTCRLVQHGGERAFCRVKVVFTSYVSF